MTCRVCVSVQILKNQPSASGPGARGSDISISPDLSMRFKQEVSPVVELMFRVLVGLYSLVSYLPYLLLRSSDSDSLSECSRRVKARSVSVHPEGPYRDVSALKTLSVCLKPGVNTLDRVFEASVRRYPEHDCLGTRELLSEEDELQEDGRFFKKVREREL